MKTNSFAGHHNPSNNQKHKISMKADLRFLFMTRKHNKIREQRIAGPQAKRSQMSSRELDTQNINGNASSGSSSKIIQAEKHLREALVSELINSRGNLNSPRMDLEDCQLFGSLTQTQPLSVEFPKAFNPRKEANMSHKEKVGQWIMTVPIYPSTMEEAVSYTHLTLPTILLV